MKFIHKKRLTIESVEKYYSSQTFSDKRSDSQSVIDKSNDEISNEANNKKRLIRKINEESFKSFKS
jgi:hypothetical protein